MVSKTLMLAGALACALSVRADVPDTRGRAFVDPVRVMWKTKPDGSYGARSRVANEQALLSARNFQVPESNWHRRGGCELENGGEAPGILIDFGKELHGGLAMGFFHGGQGQKVRVRFGESAAEAMSEIGERASSNDHAIRDTVVEVPHMGAREIGNTGFRFVRIDLVTPGKVNLEYVRAISLMRPMRQVGGFKSSDERLNRVWDTSVRTVHLCCQEYLWDGIKRDRLVWMGDTYPETMTLLSVFGAVSILPESLDYMADVTGEGEWMNGMSCYTLWWLRNLAAWYRYTGDLAYVRKQADFLERTARQVAACVSPSNTWDVTGTWDAKGFLDWPTLHNASATHDGKQALARQALEDAAFLSGAVGRDELRATCAQAAERLATLKLGPHGAKSAAAILALAGSRTPREMYDEILSRDGYKGVSTFYGYFMLEAMSAAGENQRALDTVRDYWGAMLDVGATSFWENFDIAWTNNCFGIDSLPVSGKKDIHGDYGEFCYPGFRHSLCHGWSCGPAAWCINHVLGIRPLDVGCKTVEVKPFLGDLEWAEGAMALPDGQAVKVRAVRKPSGELDVKVEAPEGVRIVRGAAK